MGTLKPQTTKQPAGRCNSHTLLERMPIACCEKKKKINFIKTSIERKNILPLDHGFCSKSRFSLRISKLH